MVAVEFTSAFANPSGSPIRELFPYLSKPGLISFAGGYPSPSLFDVEGLMDAGRRVFDDPAAALQYGATEGMPALREALAQLCVVRGISCEPDQVLVTTGSQQAFDLLVRIFVEPGTPVYLETPAYPAAIQALRLAGAAIHESPVDADGLDVERLAQQLEEAAPADRPKLLYTVPSFSNPCGTLLPQSRREALVDLALRYGFFIVEDDPYGELSFDDAGVPPLYATGQNRAGEDNPVLYLSSLSKTVAPALRVGWLLAPPDVRRRCAIAKQTSDLCTAPVAQLMAAHYLNSGRYPANLGRTCAEYQRRMSAMVQALRDEAPDTLKFVEPRGGMFLWVEFEQKMDMSRLFQSAVENGVLYVPGAAFYPLGGRDQAMRLSYATPTVEQIQEGARRLGRALAGVAVPS